MAGCGARGRGRGPDLCRRRDPRRARPAASAAGRASRDRDRRAAAPVRPGMAAKGHTADRRSARSVVGPGRAPGGARGGRGPAAPTARQAGLGRAGGQLQGRVAGGCRGDPDRDRARPGRGCADTGARGLRVRGGHGHGFGGLAAGSAPAPARNRLKYGVGVLLSTFGVVFLGEGAGAHWPGDDLALLYVALTLAACTQLQAHLLAAGSRSQVRA